MRRHFDQQKAGNEEWTPFTYKESKTQQVQLRPDRPLLIISSTSWTEDEDFNILLDFAAYYSKYVRAVVAAKLTTSVPRIFIVITGKGPLKEFYEEKIAKEDFSHVTFFTAWLEIEEYPLLLASSDLGVCLHNSSSGFDLPMKVVDMFGCNLPACAFRYRW